ncbi:MAG: exopolysaccharide biosynthesis protein [Deltaproteobacteria bacterium]|nr:exopolysaccharide biosynthesis protein [Deltaproteobacteria bacterium]
MDPERARETIAAEAPRRIRLDELLHELGACAQEELADGDEDDRPPLTVGELVDKAAEGGFGFLIGILTLIAIPFFGLSTPFGLAIALIGAQMMIGRHQPWLPKRARKRVISMKMLDRVTRNLSKRTRWIARSTRRRFEFLIMPRLVGLGIVLLALALALPIPIPGSNLVFLLPLFVYSVGVLERDGLWIVAGHVLVLIDAVLLVVFGATVLAVIERVWHWIT